MSARVLDGNALARDIRRTIAEKVRHRVANGQPRPGLAVVLVGDDPGSVIYVRLKRKDCEQVGFRADVHHLPSDATQEDVIALVDDLNANRAFHGILVQLPLPDRKSVV